jgi:hypothetical protein
MTLKIRQKNSKLASYKLQGHRNDCLVDTNCSEVVQHLAHANRNGETRNFCK